MSMFSRSSALPSSRLPVAGFSLVELLVSIGIIVLVLSIVITQQNAFNSSVLLRSQAYEIALAVRQVQLSAVSAESDGSGNFQSVLGLHFSDSAVGAANQRYDIFIDDGDGWFSGDTLRGAPGILDPRFVIADVLYNGSSVTSGAVSVTFERPNFDARFKVNSGAGAPATSGTITLQLRPRDVSTGTDCGSLREIEITATGQVTVLDC